MEKIKNKIQYSDSNDENNEIGRHSIHLQCDR